jgi:DNA-directed RNA polymerase specialized sigma24 family protein
MEENKHKGNDVLCSGKLCDSKHSFHLLFHAYAVRIYHFALSYVKNKHEAENIVHEVFTALWEGRNRLTSEISVNDFLFEVSYSKIRQLLQGRRLCEKHTKH